MINFVTSFGVRVSRANTLAVVSAEVQLLQGKLSLFPFKSFSHSFWSIKNINYLKMAPVTGMSQCVYA